MGRHEPQLTASRGVSTGIEQLDALLDGLYWGDNVVWLVDGADVAPFYAAVAGNGSGFDRVAWVTFGAPPFAGLPPDVAQIDGTPHVERQALRELLAAVCGGCDPAVRTLILLEPLDVLVERWGARQAGRFYAACCSALLRLNAIAYWAIPAGPSARPAAEVAEREAQCVLRLDSHRIVVEKAEGRPEPAIGAQLHYDRDAGALHVAPPSAGMRVASSLRRLRRERGLSQGDLAAFAGVTRSAISQAERGERGLSLETLVRLSGALGLSLDDLVRGAAAGYRVGRRVEHPAGAPAVQHLLDGAQDVTLVRLPARGSGTPPAPPNGGSGSGSALIAVTRGAVQVTLSDATPVLRAGEVLATQAAAPAAWRNVGEGQATLFWIVSPAPTAG